MKKLLSSFFNFFKPESITYLKISTKSEYFPDKNYLIISSTSHKEVAEECLKAYKERGIFSDYKFEEVVEKESYTILTLQKNELKRQTPSITEFFSDMNKVSNTHKLLLASAL